MKNLIRLVIYTIMSLLLILIIRLNFSIINYKFINFIHKTEHKLVNLKRELIKKYNANNYVKIFSGIYLNNGWEEGSGMGSNPKNAAPYIELLQQYIDDPRFNVIVDLGCGDWQIMNHIALPNNKIYKGYDVVYSIQAANISKFAKSNVQFYNINNLRDFKKQNVYGDLLIIKDVLQHLPNSEVNYFFKDILPKFKYALITNNIVHDELALAQEFTVNRDIYLGEFRPLRLMDSPFNWRNVTVVLEYPSPGPGIKQVLFYVNPGVVNK